jgi:uncharacterized protein YktB (UPF0637 family)
LYVPFTGFTDEDFEVFSLPDFDTRMPALKQRITPKLKVLADELMPSLVERTGLELFPHVAQHLRRSVNPAGETWAAFSRSARAYKPFIHLRIAINLHGVKVACFLEEDADDKPTLAKGLGVNARAVGTYLKRHPEIRSHDAEANYGRLLDGRKMSQKEIAEFAERLGKVKSQHANFSIKFGRKDERLAKPEFAGTALEALSALAPFYRLASEPGYRLKL